ncbi:TM2 domain-containing protein [Aestuariibaculum sediminum]|uniref:TM2 domain-containing protein n=1 Tax=Aestuariibaculum sediminum TaxID=2770637 RepID=UPI00293BAC03|nr:TM2 domain-containing protein [Aestuariibaculum sediminum]
MTTATEITTGDTSTTEILTPIASAVGDNLVIGILLWFFLGMLAGHRWYYGKPILWNIVFILTAGGLGVWWIIDLINMITGRF